MQLKPRNGLLLFSLLGLLGGLFSSTECAANAPNGRWYLDAAGGASVVNLPGHTSVSNGTMLMFPYNNDTFSINSQHTNAMGGLGGGYQWQFDRTYLPYVSLGIQYTHLFTSHIDGSITQFSFPEFNNYNYKFDYDANLFVLNGKVNLFQYHSFLPYVAAGVGSAYNDFSNYHEYAKPTVTPRTSPNYGSHNNPNLTYTLGAGIDYRCGDEIWLTLGYEYDSLGKLKSGSGEGSWSPTKITLDSLKNNMVFVAISYYFPASV